jgi:hypothetical protein
MSEEVNNSFIFLRSRATLALLLVFATCALAQIQWFPNPTLPAGFVSHNIGTNDRYDGFLHMPISFTFLPDGRPFYATQDGMFYLSPANTYPLAAQFLFSIRERVRYEGDIG